MRPRRGTPASQYSGDWSQTYVYFGNLLVDEVQYESGRFVGLCLSPQHDRELVQDLYEPLPIPDSCIAKVQAQDVLEHLEPARLPAVFDEVFRVLRPGGVFRVSVPDYRSPVQRARSVFDENGEVLADLMLGGHVSYDSTSGTRRVTFDTGGDAHIWFPTYESLMGIAMSSRLQECADVVAYQYFRSSDEFVCLDIPDPEMPVLRAPPLDERAGGRPVSIVIDFIK